MRVAVLLLLAGCYRPNAEAACTVTCTSSCPSHLTCRNGWCEDPNGPSCSTLDGSIVDGDNADGGDASTLPALCVAPVVHGSEIGFEDGEWFTARVVANGRYAVKYRLETNGMGGDLGVVRGTSDDVTTIGSPIFNVILTDDPAYLYRSPHIAPGGLEMFMRMEPTPSGPIRIGVSTRGAGTDIWSLPTAMTIQGAILGLGSEPSSPTATVPRHMVISNGMQGFTELRETSPKSWTLVVTQSASSYQTAAAQTVQFLGEAHLTEEGRRLVFRGQIGTASAGAFYLERATINDIFIGPAHELLANGGVSHPFFTGDCRYLYYDAPDGRIYRVVYQ